MMKKYFCSKYITTFAVATSVLSLSISEPCIASEKLTALSENDTLKLVVIDSGLGGLSVAADIARRAEENLAYEEIDVIFVNALFQAEAGYNSLATREEKVAVFDTALKAMGEKYKPDAILVGCNTLSVLLPDCSATSGTIPVTGIVDAGVDLIAKELESNPETTAILLATQTTVDEGSHRQGLIDRGIDENRFVVQSCPNLTWYIEREPEGFETELLISTFVADALEKRSSKDGSVALSFNCTHYGYSQKLWEQELANQGVNHSSTLNPNMTMADPLFHEDNNERYEDTEVTVRVISMVEISDDVIKALSPVLHQTSPATSTALENWIQVPDLFDWQNALESVQLESQTTKQQASVEVQTAE